MDNVERETQLERWRARRASAVWTMVAGFGMIFIGGNFLANVALGGALMVMGGIVMLGYCAYRIRQFREDPWKDPEIDAWEKEEMGRP